MLHNPLLCGPVNKLRFEVCFLWSGLYMCHCVKATNTFRVCTNELLTVSPQSIDRELSLPKDWMVLVEPMQSLKPSLTWHEATILCCLSNIQEEKKNQCSLTALHKEPLCLDISFLPVYFCLGCSESFSRPRGSRAGKNNVGIRGGKTAHVVFFFVFFFFSSTVYAVTPEEAASLQTISSGNIIHHGRQVRLHL